MNRSNATEDEGTDATRYALNAMANLADRIAREEVILYVGAGASASAGFRGWNDFLKVLQKSAEPALTNFGKVALNYFNDELIGKEKSLEAADWLHKALKDELPEIVSKEFGPSSGRAPSVIHHYLAILPGSLVITTNYDSLLEQAFAKAGRHTSTWTWLKVDQVVRQLKNLNTKRTGILHLHGHTDDQDSIVLTGSQYAAEMHKHKPVGELLSWLLATKTFLFVGTSLNDPDLVYLLQQDVARNGKGFGRHYALVPHWEAPTPRQEIIESGLGVILIPVRPPNDEMIRGRPDPRTAATAAILRQLSGEVSVHRYKLSSANLPTSDDPGFFLDGALSKLLNQAVSLTGSYRGDICLSPDGMSSHLSGKLSYRITARRDGEDSEGSGPANHEVLPSSVCGVAYYQSKAHRGVYLKHVPGLGDFAAGDIDTNSDIGSYGEIHYVEGDKRVQSELALPIEADGVRVGVLNLESDLDDAYSEDDQKVARLFADKAGRLYASTYERQKRGKRLEATVTEECYRDLERLCTELWKRIRQASGRGDKLALLVYRADYETGELRSQDPGKTIFKAFQGNPGAWRGRLPCFPFRRRKDQPKTFVSDIFADGRPRYHPDAIGAMEDDQMTDEYKELLQLAGPLIGFPVLIHGHIAGVIVAWHLHGTSSDLDSRDIELFCRAAHLIANAPRAHEPENTVEQTSIDKPRTKKEELISVGRVNSILDCLDQQVMGGDPSKEGLNALGRAFRQEFGGPIRAFLRQIHQKEKEFLPGSERPKMWVSPSRCRCWIRAEDSREGKPQFVLALQVSLAADEPDVNLLRPARVSPELSAVAMEPLNRSLNRATLRQITDRSYLSHQTAKHTGLVRVPGFGEYMALTFTSNPHLSFLLSRISAYRFAFQQRPYIVGRDVMVEVLRKNPILPWFVAPILVNTPDECRVEIEPRQEQPLANRLAAYLTFDNERYDGPYDESLDVKGNTGAADQQWTTFQKWADFQNDLLHEIELFGACLAQKQFFRQFVPKLEADR